MRKAMADASLKGYIGSNSGTFKNAGVLMVNYEEVEGRLICRFEGRMDTPASMQVEDEVFDHVLRRRLPTVFDLKDVTYVCSAFFRVCIKAARATGDMKITMVNTSPLVKEGFRITGLDKIMDVQ